VAPQGLDGKIFARRKKRMREQWAFPVFFNRANRALRNLPRWVSCTMLRWAVIFLIVALIAGALGFWGIAGTAAAIAKVLFFIFIAFFLLMLLLGLFVGSRV
jgi:uncharacterized membrane protein YtjA (UPF0391 family)